MVEKKVGGEDTEKGREEIIDFGPKRFERILGMILWYNYTDDEWNIMDDNMYE